MDLFSGSNLEIALYLNEGYDFGFVNGDFRVRISLDANEIITDTFGADPLVKFDCELIFSSTKNNIKRMKTYKVPVRLDFCRLVDHVPQKPFGYVILHLSDAQHIPKGQETVFKQFEYKVCGLGKEARGSNPKVLLGLRIQDVPGDEPLEKPKRERVVRKPFPKNLPEKKETPKEVENIPVGFSPLHCFEIELHLQKIQWLASLSNVHLRVHHGKGEVTWPAHKNIAETLPDCTNTLEGLMGKIAFLEEPNSVETFLQTYPPQISVCTERMGRPIVLGRATLPIPDTEKDFELSVSIKNLLTLEPMANLFYKPLVKNKGPQILRELAVEENDDAKKELQAWKEKELKNVQEEFDEKLKQEVARVENEFAEKQAKLENDLAEKVELCRGLGEKLAEAMTKVQEKESNLEEMKNKMKADFRDILNETRKEAKSFQECLLERLKVKEETINKLKEENYNLKQTSDIHKYDIKIDQIEALITEMKKTEKRLAAANEAKDFYKQQWTRVVRELHRLKSDNGENNIQVELKLRKKELQQLGLEHLINK